MSYDDDGQHTRGPSVDPFQPMDGRDLEAIVTLMEFAALILTKKPGDTFTFEELLVGMREIGSDIELREQDVRIVLGSYGSMFGKKTGKYYLKMKFADAASARLAEAQRTRAIRKQGRPDGLYTQAVRTVRLLRRLERMGATTIYDLAVEFEVTQRTVRRDLGALLAAGEKVRVNHGRVSLGHDPEIATLLGLSAMSLADVLFRGWKCLPPKRRANRKTSKKKK